MAEPNVVFLEASPERHARAVSVLSGTATVSNSLGAVPAAAGARDRLVLVDLASDLERGLRRIEVVRASVPNAQVVAVAARKDPDIILRAMRAGACEFAVLDDGV